MQANEVVMPTCGSQQKLAFHATSNKLVSCLHLVVVVAITFLSMTSTTTNLVVSTVYVKLYEVFYNFGIDMEAAIVVVS